MNFAPIALFTYNRLWHTKMTLDALLKNPEAPQSELIIFSDGPKGNDPEEIQNIKNLRAFLKTVEGFQSVKIVERATNLGLAKSIITGVSEVVNTHGKIIVLEDDILTSRSFLSYMNSALDFFENNPKVISVHGYIYPVISKLPEAFFLKGADCWGWATWKRGWDKFNDDGSDLLSRLEKYNLTDEFDFFGSYPYTQMLRDQISGKNNSWAIRWYASAFLADCLTLYPGRSLVNNIGLDNSGTHCSNDDSYSTTLSHSSIKFKSIPVEESISAKKQIADFFRPSKNKSSAHSLGKIFDFLKGFTR